MNIIVQSTGGDVSSLNGKSDSPNMTLANIAKSSYTYLKSQERTLVICLSVCHLDLPPS